MHLYKVLANTKCELIIQDPTKDIEVRDDYVTKRTQKFSDEQVVIDYVRFMNARKRLSIDTEENRSLATRLASKGYYIFCKENANDEYLLAVHASDVEVW